MTIRERLRAAWAAFCTGRLPPSVLTDDHLSRTAVAFLRVSLEWRREGELEDIVKGDDRAAACAAFDELQALRARHGGGEFAICRVKRALLDSGGVALLRAEREAAK